MVRPYDLPPDGGRVSGATMPAPPRELINLAINAHTMINS